MTQEQHEIPHYIVSYAASELSGCVAAALPQTSSLKRSIRRVRQEEQCRSTVNHRNQLILSEEDTKTNKGEAFSMFDSGEVEDRMLVFSTEENLTVLASCKHYFMDGTFKTVPVIFDQLYTIHGIKNGYGIPLVYALFYLVLLRNKFMSFFFFVYPLILFFYIL